MKRAILFALTLVFIFIGSALAETSLKAQVDKTRITTDEVVTYKLTITSSQGQLIVPAIPKFDGFDVVSQAQSSSVSFAKNNVKSILVYTYILAPKDKGKFNIEPTVVKLKDTTISSEAFEIEVLLGKTLPQPKPKQPAGPPTPQPESQKPQFIL